MIVDVRRDGFALSAAVTLEIAAWESNVLMIEIQPPMALLGSLHPLAYSQFFELFFRSAILAQRAGHDVR
jgi:hypothetical protein